MVMRECVEKGSPPHFVFSILKILRWYFLYDRNLLHDPSRCAWESLKVFLQELIPVRTPISEGQQRPEDFRRPGVARGHVLACPEPGGTDGPICDKIFLKYKTIFVIFSSRKSKFLLVAAPLPNVRLPP